MPTSKATWFITGATQGIGLILTQQLLKEGHNVVATGRDLEKLKAAVGITTAQFLPLQVDLTNENSVSKAIEEAIRTFPTIDVLVNNAGYGLIGGIEETSNAEAQASFDVNVFGTLNAIRSALPHMRKANKGHIINISSILGLIAVPGWGLYCATKFAVEGISESLAQEVKPFGINVTIIEPGYVRTNFLSSTSIAHPANPIAAYEALAEDRRKHAEEIPGTQIGDPQKVAAAIIKLSQQPEPPLRVLLGSDALQYANYKVQMLQSGIEANKAITLSTDFTS